MIFNQSYLHFFLLPVFTTGMLELPGNKVRGGKSTGLEQQLG